MNSEEVAQVFGPSLQSARGNGASRRNGDEAAATAESFSGAYDKASGGAKSAENERRSAADAAGAGEAGALSADGASREGAAGGRDAEAVLSDGATLDGGARDVRAAEVRGAEVQAGEVRAAEVRAGEVRSAEGAAAEAAFSARADGPAQEGREAAENASRPPSADAPSATSMMETPRGTAPEPLSRIAANPATEPARDGEARTAALGEQAAKLDPNAPSGNGPSESGRPLGAEPLLGRETASAATAGRGVEDAHDERTALTAGPEGRAEARGERGGVDPQTAASEARGHTASAEDAGAEAAAADSGGDGEADSGADRDEPRRGRAADAEAPLRPGADRGADRTADAGAERAAAPYAAQSSAAVAMGAAADGAAGLASGLAGEPAIDLGADAALEARTGEGRLGDAAGPRGVSGFESVRAGLAGAPAAQQAAAAIIARDGANVIEVRLDPPELGKLQIELNFDGDQVNVTVRAERDDALDQLRRSQEELERALRDAGLDPGSMTFTAQQEGGPNDEGGDAAGAGGAANGRDDALEAQAAQWAAELGIEGGRVWRGEAGGLDIRL